MKTDLTYLKSMAGDSYAVIKEMVDIFVEQVAEISEEMTEALTAKDYMRLSKLAHKAKSSVSIMGMNDMAIEMKRLELSAAESKEVEVYGEIINRFISDCSEATDELHSYLDKIK
jgi:HPt (histidine-containing phosphotransfer) domain-containing protein